MKKKYYMIFYRPKGSECFTLADVHLEQVDRQKLFFRHQNACDVANELAATYPKDEFAVFKTERCSGIIYGVKATGKGK